ncbi:MAG: hypothetical protein ACD_67C00020G0002 [uncultured bacterium]|nr:MAG: hypothetical protein ACD_67C00020G0002 [uncultured bacterium]
MPLDELNKQLYDPNSEDIINRSHEKSEYDPVASAGVNASPFDEQQQWNRPQKGLSPVQKRNIWIGVAIFFVLALMIGGGFFYQWWTKNAFHQDRVTMSFEGPKEADSTQPIKYIIHYTNNNRVTLKNAEIQLNYSENFQPMDNLNLKYLSPTASKIFVGDIAPMSQGAVELKGVFYAPKDFPVYLNSQIHFVPSNGTSELFVENKLGVKITAAPVLLEVSAPKLAVDGDRLEYMIDYQNLDVRRISNVQVRVDFPQGFQMSDSQPRASEKEGIWYVGNLESNQGGKIRINGKINGKSEEGKNFVVTLGFLGAEDKFIVYDKQELTTRIVSPILAVTQKLSDKDGEIINAGELLKFSVMFQNTGNIGLRDAIVTVELKGKILDFSKIDADKGFYDSGKNLIIWKASDVPELANINPKAGGLVTFTVPVKTIIPIENKLDKNFIVSSIAKIDSPDVPTPIDSNKIIGSNSLELKLASKVLFDTRGYFTDSKIENSGPLPLETGRETTFTIHWTIINISNDITGAKVVSSLPTGARWTGEIYPANEKVSYNERTNQIVWDAGDVPSGTGALVPGREIAFQVGVTPQINQVGEPINLLNKSVFTANDPFVGVNVSLGGNSKNTLLFEDPTVGLVKGKVVK